jgi:hypothetical protein
LIGRHPMLIVQRCESVGDVIVVSGLAKTEVL